MTPEFVKFKLQHNEKWAKTALLKIFEIQISEKQKYETTHYYNGVGFTGVDGEILSNLSKQLLRKGWLSSKQMTIVMLKMKKYSRQIILNSDEVKLRKMILKTI